MTYAEIKHKIESSTIDLMFMYEVTIDTADISDKEKMELYDFLLRNLLNQAKGVQTMMGKIIYEK